MSTPNLFKVAGVDGCRGGWFVVIASASADTRRKKVLQIERGLTADNFAEVLSQTEQCRLVCVDIPIGLSDGARPRECDLAARKVLGVPRASSVFAAPVRACLGANEYTVASSISRRFSGKGLSRQSFFILDKIRQVDDLMTVALQSRIREIHPEISFWALNGKEPLSCNKKKRAGRTKRIELLSGFFPDIDAFVAKTRQSGQVAADDILDALVAVWTAAQAVVGKTATLPANPEPDSKGLRMEMLYPVSPQAACGP